MAHFRQKATFCLVLAFCPLGCLARTEAFFLKQVDTVGEPDRQGDQLEGDANFDNRRAIQAQQVKAQRTGCDDNERRQQDAPGQRVIKAIAHAAAPDESAGQQQADRRADDHHTGEHAPDLRFQNETGQQRTHRQDQRHTQGEVQAWEVLSGMQKMAAELDRHQAMAEHQRVDA